MLKKFEVEKPNKKRLDALKQCEKCEYHNSCFAFPNSENCLNPKILTDYYKMEKIKENLDCLDTHAHYTTLRFNMHLTEIKELKQNLDYSKSLIKDIEEELKEL